MSLAHNNDLESLPNQDVPEEARIVSQVKPIPGNEKSVAAFSTDLSSDSNGQIRRRAQASADVDGLGSTTEDEKSTEADVDGLGSTTEDEKSTEADVDGLGSTRDVEKSTEGKLEDIKAVKLLLFEILEKVLGFFFPIFTVAVGCANMGHCPANSYLPYMVVAIGIMGLSIVIYALGLTLSESFDGLPRNQRLVIEVSSALLAVLGLFEAYQFFPMDVSFNSSAENYCDYQFYIFTISMNIVLALGLFIGYSLLYLDLDAINRVNDKIARDSLEWAIYDSSDSD